MHELCVFCTLTARGPLYTCLVFSASMCALFIKFKMCKNYTASHSWQTLVYHNVLYISLLLIVDSSNPFEAGVLNADSWTQSPIQTNIYFQEGFINTSRFHEYSPIIVSVSATVDGGNYSSDAYLLSSMIVWTENVDRENGNFTACYCYTGAKEIHDDPTKTKINLHYVAYQKNLHRRMSYVEGDVVALPNWRRGTQCAKIKTKVIS